MLGYGNKLVERIMTVGCLNNGFKRVGPDQDGRFYRVPCGCGTCKERFPKITSGEFTTIYGQPNVGVLEMKKLKAGDVIDVIVDNSRDCTGCVFNNEKTIGCKVAPLLLCSTRKIKFKLNKSTESPKQGDTVWCKVQPTDEWFESELVAAYKGWVFIFNDGHPQYVRYMTTEDPYALKYEMTAREALVPLSEGKVVEDKAGRRYKFVNGLMSQRIIGDLWQFCSTEIFGKGMYAIVENE